MRLLLTSVAILAAFSSTPEYPQVWLGDRSNACIVITFADGSELPCPADKSLLPDHWSRIYVIEDL